MAVLCKHADVLFFLLLFSNCSSCAQTRAEGFLSRAWRQLVILNAKTGIFKSTKRIICRILKRKITTACLAVKALLKQRNERPTQSAKESRGHLGSEERSPRWLQRCWTSTISHPSVVTAPSWGQNKSMSVEKARSWHALLLGWTVYRWHGVKREARPASHSFNAESMGSSFLTSWAPPTPPPHLSGTTTFHYTLWVSPLRERVI